MVGVNSRYTKHILETSHSNGKIEDALKILKVAKKGSYMNTSQRFHMYNISKQGIQINHYKPHL
jgi:hypothetical protein